MRRAAQLLLGLTLNTFTAHLHRAMAVLSPDISIWQIVHVPPSWPLTRPPTQASPAPWLQPLRLSVRYGGRGGALVNQDWAVWEGGGKGMGAENAVESEHRPQNWFHWSSPPGSCDFSKEKGKGTAPGNSRVKALFFHSKLGERFVLEFFSQAKNALVAARLQMQGCVLGVGGGSGGGLLGKTSSSEGKGKSVPGLVRGGWSFPRSLPPSGPEVSLLSGSDG